MRYKLEVPLTARLASGRWIRRFRAPEARGGNRSAALNNVNVVYGATLPRAAWAPRGDNC